jgi:hypothetical protein
VRIHRGRKIEFAIDGQNSPHDHLSPIFFPQCVVCKSDSARATRHRHRPRRHRLPGLGKSHRINSRGASAKPTQHPEDEDCFDQPYKQTHLHQLSTQRAQFCLGTDPPCTKARKKQEESKTLVTNQHSILAAFPQRQPQRVLRYNQRAGELTEGVEGSGE